MARIYQRDRNRGPTQSGPPTGQTVRAEALRDGSGTAQQKLEEQLKEAIVECLESFGFSNNDIENRLRGRRSKENARELGELFQKTYELGQHIFGKMLTAREPLTEFTAGTLTTEIAKIQRPEELWEAICRNMKLKAGSNPEQPLSQVMAGHILRSIGNAAEVFEIWQESISKATRLIRNKIECFQSLFLYFSEDYGANA